MTLQKALRASALSAWMTWSVLLVERVALDMGLQLNCSKSEVICDDSSTCEEVLLEAPGLRLISCDVADIFGCPIDSVEHISDVILRRIKKLRVFGERLHLLHSHDTVLLCHSFLTPKILYILCTPPCVLLGPASSNMAVTSDQLWATLTMYISMMIVPGFKLCSQSVLEWLASSTQPSLPHLSCGNKAMKSCLHLSLLPATRRLGMLPSSKPHMYDTLLFVTPTRSLLHDYWNSHQGIQSLAKHLAYVIPWPEHGWWCHPGCCGTVPGHAPLWTPQLPTLLMGWEHIGLSRLDGKRPDGASVMPWKGGKVLVLYATCLDALATSYISTATKEAGTVTKEAAKRRTKYAHLEASHHFVLVAVVTFQVFGPKACSFIHNLRQCIRDSTQELLSHHYLLYSWKYWWGIYFGWFCDFLTKRQLWTNITVSYVRWCNPLWHNAWAKLLHNEYH